MRAGGIGRKLGRIEAEARARRAFRHPQHWRQRDPAVVAAAADIAVAAREPLLLIRSSRVRELVGFGVLVQRIDVVEQRRREGRAFLVDRHRMAGRAHEPRQVGVEELELRIHLRGQRQAGRYAQRADRVPHPDILQPGAMLAFRRQRIGAAGIERVLADERLVGIAVGGAKRLHAGGEGVLVRLRRRGVRVAAIELHGVEDVGGLRPPKDPGPAQQPRQAASGIGPAAEAEDEDAIARLVVQADELVGAGDLVVQALAERAAEQLRHRVGHALTHSDPVVIVDELRRPARRLGRHRPREHGDIGRIALVQMLPGAVAEDHDVLHDEIRLPVTPAARVPGQIALA